jgi:NADH-quinone oxidoreductase subunit A
MLSQYIPLVWLFGVAGAVVAAILILTSIIGPKKRDPVKAEIFECGSEAVGSPRARFSVKFYMVAITFIVFDIETVFVIPWTVVYKDLGMLGFGAMAIFLSILTVGLIYEWKGGGLEWE